MISNHFQSNSEQREKSLHPKLKEYFFRVSLLIKIRSYVKTKSSQTLFNQMAPNVKKDR